METKEAKSGIFLLIAMTLVNVINYAINLFLGRILGPVQFADFHIIATFVLVFAFIGIAIQMTAAKISASQAQQKLLSWLHDRLRIFTIVSTALVCIASPTIAYFFKFDSSIPFLILSISLPVYFLLCFYRGILQGQQRFNDFAISFVIETIVRLITTILVLVFFSSHLHIISFLAVCFILSFLATYAFSKSKASYTKTTEKQNIELIKPILYFVAFMGLYECSQIIISHSDVFLVKHFLSPEEAGQYASVSLIGRMIYYGTWTFVMLLFPKVIAAKEKGEDPTKLLLLVGGLVAAIGISTTIFTCYFGEILIQVLFGNDYISSSRYLYRYAASTTLFALSNVIVYYYLSLDKYLPVWISLLFGLLQICAIYIIHDSIYNIIKVQIVLMSVLLILLLIYHTIEYNRSLLKSNKSKLNPELN